MLEVSPRQGNLGAGPLLSMADNLEEQFACAEYLVEEERAFFDTVNLERLKNIPLSEASARLIRSVRWNNDRIVSKRK